MSRSGKVRFAWADGEYDFRLGIGQIEELQDKTDCGPQFLLSRLIDGTWRVQDIRETIRVALIGAGMEPAKAGALVRRYVDDRPLLENLQPARAILLAALSGAPDGEKPGKRKAARTKEETNPPAESLPSPQSTAPEPS